MATDYDGERFIEAQAILAAQVDDQAALAEILDKFLPNELRALRDAADTLAYATRGRLLYLRHQMQASPRAPEPVYGKGPQKGCTCEECESGHA